MKSYSAKHYFILFSIGGFVIFFLLAGNEIYRAETVKRAVDVENRLAAEKEIKRAVNKVTDEVKKLTQRLAGWDEVHQQLTDPTYYVYWRETRSKDQDYLPDFVTAFELYDKSGVSLVHMATQDMPGTTPEQDLFLDTITSELYAFEVIKSRVPGEGVNGYLGIKVNLIEVLRELNRFTLIHESSLKIKDSPLPLQYESLHQFVDYDVVGQSEESPLATVVQDTLRDYFILFLSMIAVYYFLVHTLFINPLQKLNHHIKSMSHGVRDYGPVPGSVFPAVQELVTTWESLNSYQRELDETRVELDNRNAELWELAHVDSLTGINNRMAFDRDWKELLNVTRKTRIEVSLALFDCDFFKAINDTYGHEMGDQVIQSIGAHIREALREGDTLYRLGGDEFLAIFLNCDAKQAYDVAKRCAATVELNTAKELGLREGLKLSVGLAHAAGSDTANLSELPRQADIAMYHAKGATREKVVIYKHELEQDAYAMVTSHVVSSVLEAIESGTNLSMHYQPIVDAVSGKVSHYEALVRVVDEGGLITPAEIFPIVSRRRLEVELDLAILRSVEQDLASGSYPKGVGVAINVSPALLGRSEFCSYFMGLSAYLNMHPIIIEVTETTLITHLQHASECLATMRESGFTVALDDFGSGYSSLRYLANMPVDIVKFDISMVQAIQHDERSRNIIYDTANMIHNAGYKLVAEGIEDEAVRMAVMPIKPSYLQGYLYDRPLPLYAIAEKNN